ncbi:MAG: hypothetical protein AB1847_10390 [bacterium]
MALIGAAGIVGRYLSGQAGTEQVFLQSVLVQAVGITQYKQ